MYIFKCSVQSKNAIKCWTGLKKRLAICILWSHYRWKNQGLVLFNRRCYSNTTECRDVPAFRQLSYCPPASSSCKGRSLKESEMCRCLHYYSNWCSLVEKKQSDLCLSARLIWKTNPNCVNSSNYLKWPKRRKKDY